MKVRNENIRHDGADNFRTGCQNNSQLSDRAVVHSLGTKVDSALLV